jgi:hypothetical protein
MNMRERIGNLNRSIITLTVGVMIASALTGCPNTPVKNSPGGNNGNSPTAAPQSTAPTNSGQSGSLATPTDAYRTVHALRGKKDIEGLKKLLSKDILEFFTEMGKLEKKTLDEMLLDLCLKPQEATPEARNEKITGDRAIIEYKDEKGEWKKMDFEKEGSEWKLTLPKAEQSPGSPGIR